MSDVATPMGLPIPGWTLTQILRIPSPGGPEEATIADVCRKMYEQGYDFRHYLAGGIVPALVEIVVRTYHFLRYEYSSRDPVSSQTPVLANLAEKQAAKSQEDARLKAMLFWSHATAAAMNAGKVLVQGVTGDYFSAIRAINLAEWQLFALRTIQYLGVRLRDKKLEQIGANRKLLNERWDLLSSQPLPYRCFDFDDAPRLTILQGGKP